MMIEQFEHIHPSILTLYRFDETNRVDGGFETARTILARHMGKKATFGFSDMEVTMHLASNYTKRLETPSRTESGIGSPFVSAALEPSNIHLAGLAKDETRLATSSLFRFQVPRSRVIVPKLFKPPGSVGYNWQRFALELLVIGDISPEDVEVVDTARNIISRSRQT